MSANETIIRKTENARRLAKKLRDGAPGWTFDPTREIWWAKTGPSTWSEVKGAYDDPPTWRPTR